MQEIFKKATKKAHSPCFHPGGQKNSPLASFNRVY